MVAVGVEHVPLPARHWLAGVNMFVIMSQDAAGQDAVVQQTRSTHVRPAPQSVFTVQAWPGGRPVHWPVLVLHVIPFAQWASDEQLVRHAVASAQVKPFAQGAAAGAVVQAPVAAEHDRSGVDMFMEHIGPSHDALMQQTLSTQPAAVAAHWFTPVQGPPSG